MKKILAIDDEPAVLKCLSDALKMRGYEMIVTGDPDEGLKILRSDPTIDLLLLDIKMPGRNGFDVYREFREFRNQPVLFVTAYLRSLKAGSAPVAERWMKAFSDGMTDIIYKPFNLSVFFEKVENLIGKASEPTDATSAAPGPPDREFSPVGTPPPTLSD